jgi:hypothetical protein
MFDRLRQLFNKILFRIKCSFHSSCCINEKENPEQILDAVQKSNIFIES